MAHDVRNLPLYLSKATTRSLHDRDDDEHRDRDRDQAARAGYAEDDDSADTANYSHGLALRSSSPHRLSFPQSVRSFATVTTTNHHGSLCAPSPPPPLPISGPSQSTNFASSGGASDAAGANDGDAYHAHQHPYAQTHAYASLPPPSASLTGAAKARAIGAAARAESSKIRPDLPRSSSTSTIRAGVEQHGGASRGESTSASSFSPRQGASSNAELPPHTTMAGSHSTTAAPSYSKVDPNLISALSLAPNPHDEGSQSSLPPFPPRSLSGSLRHCADQPGTIHPSQQSRSCPPSSSSSPLQSHEAVFASPSPSPPLTSLSPPTPQRAERFRHASSPQTSHATSGSSISSASSFLASSTNTFQSIGAKLQSAKFKDRFHAVGEQAKEWSGKGKGKIADAWVRKAANGINQITTASNINSRSTPPLIVDNRPDSAQSGGSFLEPMGTYRSNSASGTDFRAPSPSHSLDGNSDSSLFSGIRLPCLILGVRVPRRSGMAFGIKLDRAVQLSSVTLSDVHRKRDEDPITGDEAKSWLPAVAYRCLQYLEEWGKKEEGIYRIPGRSNMINQLRALFDAGMDKDLREIHPGDLDPHAVASLLKLWLRELPESLISSQLEAAVDMLTQEAIGYSASSSNFLYQQQAPPTTGGLIDGRAPKPYLEKLRELFGNGMPAEHFYLLRGLSYHLARLSSYSSTNKMTLSNLRLILSPTFRLSPVFVQVLVEDREIIFGRMNEDARLRDQGFVSPTIQSPILGPAHSPASPPLLFSPKMEHTESSQPHAHRSSSPSSTPPTSPFFSAEPIFAAPTPPTLPFRTPIAERFAQYRVSPMPEEASSVPSPKAVSCDLPSLTPNGFSSGPAFNSSNPAFLPSRNVVNGGGFFGGSRDKGHSASLSSGGASTRKNSTDSGRSNGSSIVSRSDTSEGKTQDFQLNLPQGFGLGLSVPSVSSGKDDEDPWGLMRSVEKT
ncbi:BQ5605_C014g07523 [Microbotryum silenes-dioicae]|uniref:BQ5605_C014g07523 protein n=1 Tax=Microbotryum silenes-dioicae TaxID=796604 RepID=A0A2X0LXS4_9BASI|nr:BQ5605_C014g07523 [Microbotryum silenes-dioicae]